MNHCSSLKNAYGYLTKTPTKKDIIDNACISGNVSLLENSNNRAIVIYTKDAIYLQSYDTLILEVKGGVIRKLWNGYSVTTLKHVNEFLSCYGIRFNKKEWSDFETTTI